MVRRSVRPAALSRFDVFAFAGSLTFAFQKKGPRSEERGPCLTFFLFSALRTLRIALTLTLTTFSLRVEFGVFQNAFLTSFFKTLLASFSNASILVAILLERPIGFFEQFRPAFFAGPSTTREGELISLYRSCARFEPNASAAPKRYRVNGVTSASEMGYAPA